MEFDLSIALNVCCRTACHAERECNEQRECNDMLLDSSDCHYSLRQSKTYSKDREGLLLGAFCYCCAYISVRVCMCLLFPVVTQKICLHVCMYTGFILGVSIGCMIDFSVPVFVQNAYLFICMEALL